MSAELIVHTLLDQATGVTALVSTRITSGNRAEGSALPAVVHSAITDRPRPPIGSTPGAEPWEGRVQVACFAATRAAAKDIVNAAIAACHKQGGTIAGFSVTTVLADVAGPSSYDALVDAHQDSVDFLVYYFR